MFSISSLFVNQPKAIGAPCGSTVVKKRDRSDFMTFALLLLAACLPELQVEPGTTDCIAFLDKDGDGFGDAEWSGSCDAIPETHVEIDGDCDDDNAEVHPDASELCNGLDDDCDGDIDEDAEQAWYVDSDGDGYGGGEPTYACDQPSSVYVDNGDDCDDADAETYPDAPVECSDLDRNCDGQRDDADLDGDGYAGCEECDDTNAEIHPDALEICDGVDQDCDGELDEDPTDGQTWYRDVDADGFGDASDAFDACEQPEGYSADATDCDDTRDDIHPDATEICNGLDDDCDGDIDSTAVDALTWYVDVDGDGYGSTVSTTLSCDQPSGYAATDDDCDDDDTAYNPGAAEDDCSDPNDYNCDGATGYVDGDGDGWAACEECDDSDADVNPDGTELCDSVDNDCDGTVDEDDAEDAATYYADTDGDGYGDASSTTEACSAPSGYVSDATDCDDADGSISPSATEVCDSADNDCDGTTDEDDASDASTWYADTDGDGYGDSSSTTEACEVPSGYVADATDCDDSDGDVSPSGTEVCDSVDNDCDGTIDPGTSADASTWYADSDGDGYGDSSSSADACDQPTGYVSDASDCEDSDADVNPDADEECDGVDNDCDGDTDEDAIDASTWYEDADGDSYGDASSTAEACDVPSGYSADASDCDDGDGDVNPGATEYCDSVDNDCDGTTDEDDAADASTWYGDSDGDGYGDSSDTDVSCDAASGYVSASGDCDDGDGDVNPGADETCDGIDNDCDGATDEDDAIDASTWYSDSDGDSYGNSGVSTTACDQPSGYVSDATDCDDSDGSVNPDADEYCDSVDNDCDGTTDEDDALDASTWYIDSDGDGYGVSDTTTEACTVPAGYASTSDDCDDSDEDVNPGESEACNGVDDDCDGSTDEGFTDTDSDGTADCVDDCPVYADPSLSSNGDGSESSPYMSINDAITLRGGSCDQIVLKAGTYSEQVDYGGDDLDIYSEDGANKTIIDGSSYSGSVVSFTGGETASAVLEGVTVQNGTGTTGDGTTVFGGYSLDSSSTHGGGIYIDGSDPTITGCVIEDNAATGFGGGVLAIDYDGTFDGNTVEDNDAGAENYSGGGMYVYDSGATISDSDFEGNVASGSSGDGGGLTIADSDVTVTGNWFEANESNGYGDGVRLLAADGLFANNVLFDHDAFALALSDGGSIDVVNNTIDGNGYGVIYFYNTAGYPSGDLVNNLITNNDYYGLYASYYPCVSLGSISYNDVYNNGWADWTSSYCKTYWSGYGNISKDPSYQNRGSDDFSLKKGSVVKDAGDDTDGYGVTDDYDGDSRSTGAYSMGAYERD